MRHLYSRQQPKHLSEGAGCVRTASNSVLSTEHNVKCSGSNAACRAPQGPKSRNSKDPPQTPASTTPLSSCSSQSDESSCCSTGRSNDQLPASSTCRSSALHRGRRSSVLRAAALPGHQLCREPPASRSLLLQKMPKARQRAFLAYTQQMAKYYAEVGARRYRQPSKSVCTELAAGYMHGTKSGCFATPTYRFAARQQKKLWHK